MYASTKKSESGTDRRIRCDDDGNTFITENSINILTGGQTNAVSISTTSAQSSAINVEKVVIYSTVFCFVRQGANPTALSNGTDQPVPAETYLRVTLTPGNKLAFITASGTGTVYITPGA
ncbi:hypothetical protein V2P20_08995 [Methylobacter sp. Wu1]|uniref:hypothetical protein n=1 Tax=Methylobacter sp. Wu1 TaxID=3119359 RepID=UPI002F9483E2